MSRLQEGPQMIGGEALDIYGADSERLEREGVVMRCGLTPTDIMHIRGDYSAFDGDAARLAARYFLRCLPQYRDDAADMAAFCDQVYEMVMRRLYENLLRVFVEATYPEICAGGIDAQLQAFIARGWEKRNEPEAGGFFRLNMDAQAALIGIGAPTHLFLPEVARALGVECVIPEHSEVANAVGAAAAKVSAQANVEVHAVYSSEGVDGWMIHAPGVNERYADYDDAVEAAKLAAVRLAKEEAHRRGAMGEIQVEISVNDRSTITRTGAELRLGAIITGIASN